MTIPSRFLILLSLATAALWGQAPPPNRSPGGIFGPQLRSPEVSADGRVTFRFRAPNAKQVMYIACGTEDTLLGDNREFKEWLKSKDVQFQNVETPGAYTWMVWRRNLTEFAPLLFQAKK